LFMLLLECIYVFMLYYWLIIERKMKRDDARRASSEDCLETAELAVLHKRPHSVFEKKV